MHIQELFTTVKDTMPMIGEVIGALLCGIMIGFWGIWKQKRSSLKKLLLKDKRFVQNHTQLHEVLTELRLMCSCSRSLIFQFHNGGNFSDGSSMKRFSVTHESVASGIQSMILESQDVLLTRYMELVRILETNPHKIIRVESLPESSFRAGLQINNVMYFSASPLKHSDGLIPMGFVCCHWCFDEDLENLAQEGLSHDSVERSIEHTSKTINSHLVYNMGQK